MAQTSVSGASLTGYGTATLYKDPRFQNGKHNGAGLLDRWFKLSERGSTVSKEFRAGTASFLTISYILLVNPAILGAPNTDIPTDDVVFGTAVGSIIGSLVCGLLANLPFTMAPGLGLSAYFSYGLVQGEGLPWQGALTCCTIAGTVMLVLAVTNLSNFIMTIIPNTIKVATVVGMGLLLTMIGMQKISLVVASNDESLVKLGSLENVDLWISLSGLVLLGTLSFHKIRGSILIGILTVTLIIWTRDDAWPERYVSMPGEKDVSEIVTSALSFHLINSSYINGIASFMVVGVFDVSGVLFGLGRMAELADPRTGELPGCKYAFVAASIGTIVAALFGCSPIIPAIESAAGIKEGGRTGLTAIFSAAWFSIALFLSPVFGNIPVEATSPVLILIGAAMMGEASEIDWSCMYQALPGFLTLTIMPFTFSIPNGIVFGTVFLVILYLTTGQFLRSEQRIRRLSAASPADVYVEPDSFEPEPAATGQAPLRRLSFSSPLDAIRQPTYVRKPSALYLSQYATPGVHDEEPTNLWSHTNID